MRVVIVEPRPFDRLALGQLCMRDPHCEDAIAVGDADAAMALLADRSSGAVVLLGNGVLRENGHETVARLRAAGAGRLLLVGVGSAYELGRQGAMLGVDGVLRRDGEVAGQLAALRGTDGAIPRWAPGTAAR